jgi:hypothetical protein
MTVVLIDRYRIFAIYNVLGGFLARNIASTKKKILLPKPGVPHRPGLLGRNGTSKAERQSHSPNDYGN